MHEVATSQSLADAVLREAQARNATRVLRVEVEVGELSFLEPEQIAYWAEMCFQGTVGEGAKLDIRLIRPLVACEECGYEGELRVEEHPAYHLRLPVFQCPGCGSSRLEVKRGRGCTLRRVELELEGEAPS